MVIVELGEGEKYRGELVDGLRMGYGKMLWKSSSFYEGEWE